MKYYPVIIPTLCRFEHFKRCIESLSNCTRSDEVDCYVALDYPLKESHWEGYNKIKDYLEHCRLNFHKLEVILRKENYGAYRNLEDLINLVLQEYDCYILSEDDNEFSPCFLDYMIKCFEQYRDDDRVYSICGYATPNYKDLSDRNIIFTLGNSAYGVGYWTDKERKMNREITKEYYKQAISSFKSIVKLYKLHRYFLFGFSYCLLHDRFYGDLTWSCYSYLNNKYQIKPAVSLVRNWGNDGSGLHSGYDPRVALYEISADKVFNLDPKEPVALNKRVLREMEREVASSRLKTRLHQEIGAFVYPLLYMVLRKLRIK